MSLRSVSSSCSFSSDSSMSHNVSPLRSIPEDRREAVLDLFLEGFGPEFDTLRVPRTFDEMCTCFEREAEAIQLKRDPSGGVFFRDTKSLSPGEQLKSLEIRLIEAYENVERLAARPNFEDMQEANERIQLINHLIPKMPHESNEEFVTRVRENPKLVAKVPLRAQGYYNAPEFIDDSLRGYELARKTNELAGQIWAQKQLSRESLPNLLEGVSQLSASARPEQAAFLNGSGRFLMERYKEAQTAGRVEVAEFGKIRVPKGKSPNAVLKLFNQLMIRFFPNLNRPARDLEEAEEFLMGAYCGQVLDPTKVNALRQEFESALQSDELPSSAPKSPTLSFKREKIGNFSDVPRKDIFNAMVEVYFGRSDLQVKKEEGIDAFMESEHPELPQDQLQAFREEYQQEVLARQQKSSDLSVGLSRVKRKHEDAVVQAYNQLASKYFGEGMSQARNLKEVEDNMRGFLLLKSMPNGDSPVDFFTEFRLMVRDITKHKPSKLERLTSHLDF